MLSPVTIPVDFFAPCGMNCLVCYKQLGKKPCAGCLRGDENKPGSCRACKLRECTKSKGVRHCFSCAEFPCKRLRALDHSYRDRYGVSLVEYGRAAACGIDEFLREQTALYTCADCGGLISLHDGVCSECGRKYQLGRNRSV